MFPHNAIINYKKKSFLNTVFRLVHGHRPYWYAMESLYHITTPKIKQFDGWTCETTPGT